MALTACIDHATGLDLSLFALYWPAMALATWCGGLRCGGFVVVLSVGMAAADDAVLGRFQIHPAMALIAAATRLLSSLAFVWILAKHHEAYAREGETRRLSEATAGLKSELMSLMSHEVNNSIAVLKMTLFLLRENEPEPPLRRKEAYEVFGRVLLNMELVARNFLNNARITAGRLTLSVEPVDLRQRIETTVVMFSPLLLQRRLALTVDVPQELPKVIADRAAVALILGNLVSNAVKYTPEGGCITLKAGLSPVPRPSVRVSVADTGIGISIKDRRRILDGFVRLPAGQHMAKGFGLGLKTVHDLLALHGTHLDLDSQPRKGSTFSFTLPLAEPRPQAAGIGGR